METKELKLKEITVFGKSIKTKRGVDFIKYQYTKDGVKFYDIKFTKDCATKPELLGYVKLTFDKTTSFMMAGEVGESGFKNNDVIWIRNLISYEQDLEYAKLHPSKKQQELNELFED